MADQTQSTSGGESLLEAVRRENAALRTQVDQAADRAAIRINDLVIENRRLHRAVREATCRRRTTAEEDGEVDAETARRAAERTREWLAGGAYDRIQRDVAVEAILGAATNLESPHPQQWSAGWVQRLRRAADLLCPPGTDATVEVRRVHEDKRGTNE